MTPQAIEEWLVEKAEAADRRDFTGQRSLGQMSREEPHKFLFGEWRGTFRHVVSGYLALNGSRDQSLLSDGTISRIYRGGGA
jgi:hypothetical protein